MIHAVRSEWLLSSIVAPNGLCQTHSLGLGGACDFKFLANLMHWFLLPTGAAMKRVRIQKRLDVWICNHEGLTMRLKISPLLIGEVPLFPAEYQL